MSDEQRDSRRAMLRDVERIDGRVDEVLEAAQKAEATAQAALELIAQCPLFNLSPMDLMFVIAGGAAAAQSSGGFEAMDKKVFQKAKAVATAWQVWKGEIEAPWEVAAREMEKIKREQREAIEAAGRLRQSVAGAVESPTNAAKAFAASIPGAPPLIPHQD